MDTPTRVCPYCNCANHARASFCYDCNALLACMPTGPVAAASEPAPHGSVDAPRPDTQTLLKRVAADCGFECKKTRAGYHVTVPLKNDRKQKVHVLFNGRDNDGEDIISFLSVCAPADERQAITLLRLNSKLTYAAFAVRPIEGKDCFVVTSNQLASTSDPEEIRKQLIEVAKRADAVEKKLTRGGDVY